jgi:uncharacterized membrane protein
MVATLILRLLESIPRFSPVLGYKVALPVWVVAPISVALSVLIVSLWRSVRRERANVCEAERKLKLYQQSFYVFDCFGARWEIGGAFLQTFRSSDYPSVEALIQGPLCPKCQSSLNLDRCSVGIQIQSPCARCGNKIAGSKRIYETLDLKLDVYKEAQRLARRGEFPPQGNP